MMMNEMMFIFILIITLLPNIINSCKFGCNSDDCHGFSPASPGHTFACQIIPIHGVEHSFALMMPSGELQIVENLYNAVHYPFSSLVYRTQCSNSSCTCSCGFNGILNPENITVAELSTVVSSISSVYAKELIRLETELKIAKSSSSIGTVLLTFIASVFLFYTMTFNLSGNII